MLRQAKGLQLTQAGEAMANHARLVLQQLEVMHADLRPYALGVKGRIRLQANSTATNTFWQRLCLLSSMTILTLT